MVLMVFHLAPMVICAPSEDVTGPDIGSPLHEAKGSCSDEQMIQDFSGSHKLFFSSLFVRKIIEKLHCYL